MSYNSEYTGLELDDTIRHTISPDYFGYAVNDDVADTVAITVADQYETFIPDPLHLDSWLTDEFSYNETTGEITYTGLGGDELYQLLGNASVAFSVVNTIMHFAIAVNGVTMFESSAKAESTTAIVSLGLSSFLELENGDVITVEVKADKTGTLEAFHTQGTITEVKPDSGGV